MEKGTIFVLKEKAGIHNVESTQIYEESDPFYVERASVYVERHP